MDGLSDLELVAQAMAPRSTADQPKAAEPANSAPQPTADGSSQPGPSDALDPAALEGLDGLDDLDLSSLSEFDRAALLPLLAAIKLDSGDEGDMEDVLRAMEAAEGVADDLEGKLDRLLESLGRAEGELLDAQPAAAGGEDGAGQGSNGPNGVEEGKQ